VGSSLARSLRRPSPCACIAISGPPLVGSFPRDSYYIRSMNFQLLEIAKPEAVILRAASLPAAYLRQYFLGQEHLSAVGVVRAFAAQEAAALESAALDRPMGSRKLLVYTRTTHDMAIVSGPQRQSLSPFPDQMQVWRGDQGPSPSHR
jgi:hypothetical protein